MKVHVISKNRELQNICKEALNDISAGGWTLTTSAQEDNDIADVHIWNIKAASAAMVTGFNKMLTSEFALHEVGPFTDEKRLTISVQMSPAIEPMRFEKSNSNRC